MNTWICPRTNECSNGPCSGEIKPLLESAFVPQYGRIEPKDGCVGIACGLAMPKRILKPKYVWSRAKVWESFLGKGGTQNPNKIHPQPEPSLKEIFRQPEAPSPVPVQQTPQKPDCVEGAFCCGVDREKHPATEEDVARFFNPPMFSTCRIMVGKRTVTLDCSTDVKVKRGANTVWFGTYRDLRDIGHNGALECLKYWASKSSK